MTRSEPISTAQAAPRALIVSIQTPTQTDAATATSLAELGQLLSGLGITVAHEVVQKRRDVEDVHVLGKGKLEEVQALLAEGSDMDQKTGETPWLVVFDGELSPSQQRSLGRALDVEVVDRTQVILSIFQRRARTRVAQLEIELARLDYETPRVRDNQSLLARQAGGGGRGGRGHTVAELKKQQLRRRISALRADLDQAKRAQMTRRERRQQVASVALVGYTNAGKSSWMRALTGSAVEVEDALFATLDTTVRALFPSSSPRIVVADTVGFLRNLPNHLLASFRSTLDEALDADLLLFVVDATDPEWEAQLEVTREVIAEVGANELPHLVLLNKCDRLTPEQLAACAERLPGALRVSCRNHADVARVRQALIDALDGQCEPAALRVPYTQGALLGAIRKDAHVLSERFDEAGVLVELRAKAAFIATWKKQLASSGP